jgi:hypothetical protein
VITASVIGKLMTFSMRTILTMIKHWQGERLEVIK